MDPMDWENVKLHQKPDRQIISLGIIALFMALLASFTIFQFSKFISNQY